MRGGKEKKKEEKNKEKGRSKYIYPQDLEEEGSPSLL